MEPTPCERLATLEKRREQLEARRIRILKEVEEIDADIAALRRVVDRRLLDPVTTDAESEDGPAHGEVKEAVLKVLSLAQSPFNAKTIAALIDEMNPGRKSDSGAVSTCLRRLAEKGEGVVECEAGAGRRMTTYRHLDPSGEVAA